MNNKFPLFALRTNLSSTPFMAQRISGFDVGGGHCKAGHPYDWSDARQWTSALLIRRPDENDNC
jgi:hypothetical protein